MPSTVPQPLGSNLPLTSSLPKVSFRRIPEHESQALLLPAGVNDQQHVGYGFNDGSTFEKPEHYMRFIEPIEADLKKQVEYDMDEQDKEWLDAVNVDRRKVQLDSVSYEAFEVIIDRLEKEWFDLMRRVPAKPQPAAIGPDGEPLNNNEDTQCAICDDGECENSNAIVFCDGCNLAVHQDCYGIPYIPEGQWLCRKCTVSPDRAVSCILCPSEGGAFKQTTQGKWAHLLCGLWIPETSVSNQVYMEPIDSVEKIPKARWKLQCYLCHSRHGACIQCDNKTCFTAFHVTCARKVALLIKAQRQRSAHAYGDSDAEEDGEPLRAMCHKHLPKDLRAAAQANIGSNGKVRNEDGESSTRASTPVLPPKTPTSRKITIRRGANGCISAIPAASSSTIKSARAYKKSYRAGPPLVPTYIIERVVAYIKKVPLRKKDQLVNQVAKFWSLKREARRGAPLLKRLHLEPWTAAGSSSREQTEADRAKKLQFMLLLREDLERLRMLAELARKREQQKLRQINLIRTSLIDRILFPVNDELRSVLEKIVALDRNGLFMNPVSRSDVPDYYDVIKHPMDWAKTLGKIDDHQYCTVQEFADDVTLVCDNAILYNKADTSFHRTALKIKMAAAPLLAGLGGAQRAPQVQAHEAGVSALELPHHARRLQLEPEPELLGGLEDYDQDQKERSLETGEDILRAPANYVEDLIRQYHVVSRPPPHVPTPEEQARRLRRETAAAQKAENRLKNNAAAAEYRRRKRLEKEEAVAAPGNGREEEGARRSLRSLQSAQSSPPATRGVLPDRSRSTRRAGSAVRTFLRGRPSDSHLSSARNGQRSPRGLTVKKLNDHDTFTRFEAGWILPAGAHRARKSLTAAAETGSSPRRARERIVSTKAAKQHSTRASRQRDSLVASSSDLSDADEEAWPESASREGRKRANANAAEFSSHSSRKRPRHSLAIDHMTPASRGNGILHSRASGAEDETGYDPDPTLSKARSAMDQSRASKSIQTNENGTINIEGAEPTERTFGKGLKRPAMRQSRQSGVLAADDSADLNLTLDGNGVASKVTRKNIKEGKYRDRGQSSPSRFPEPSTSYPPLTLVWAKIMSFPYYPAAIVDEQEETVPPAVLKEGERQRARASMGSPRLYLVRFFDQARSYGWSKEDKLAMLLEDESVDQGFVNAVKAPKGRKEIEEAVQEARKTVDV